MDTVKQKIFMLQLLKDIFSDALLSSVLAIKGASAAMFFYNLPRFSYNLDFNLLDQGKEEQVYGKLRKIVQKYDSSPEETPMPHGLVMVSGQRKLRIEISKRQWNNHYEMHDYLGLQMRVMSKEDLFAHKLCKLLGAGVTPSRHVFDSWFYLKERTSLNKAIVEARTEMPLADYLDKCIENLEELPESELISEIRELDDGGLHSFARRDIKDDLIYMLSMFKARPLYL